MSLVHSATRVFQVSGIKRRGTVVALITSGILAENNVSGHTG